MSKKNDLPKVDIVERPIVVLLKSLSDELLIQTYLAAFRGIYQSDCYGSKDVLALDMMHVELSSRGYVIQVTQNPLILKPSVDIESNEDSPS